MKLTQNLYTIQEAAEILSLSVQQIHDLADSGELRERPGITADSIAKLLARKSITVKQESAG
jgi:hypothetical protein